MAKVNVVIPGIEKVDELIKRHYELLKALEDNTAQLYADRLELEFKLNQPIIAEEDKEKKAERINVELLKGRMTLNEARGRYGFNPIIGGDISGICKPDVMTIRKEKTNVYKTISNFLKRERSEAEKALKSEKRQVCIKADSYIAKEIKYQTALLHELLDEVRSTKSER